MANFAAQVDEWTRQTEARMLAVFRGATQELVSRAQARIPIDTGFARASIRASLEEMPKIQTIDLTKMADGSYSYNYGTIAMVINSAQLGQKIYIGWTASYVPYLEYGHSKQAPNGFIGITALEWPEIVAGEIAKAKASVASRS